MTGFQLFGVGREGCHMWGGRCSPFPEHMLSLPLGGGAWFHPFIVYILYVTDFVSCGTMFADW